MKELKQPINQAKMDDLNTKTQLKWKLEKG